VNPALVDRGPDGKLYTVRYDAVNAMLLNEFIKEHGTVQELKATVAKQEAIIAQQGRKIQKQEATIMQLEKGMKTVVARLEEQESQIQKVSEQIEVSKGRPQLVTDAPIKGNRPRIGADR
jgi:septal ring factor EnvC (AmiA/AmiB activator)